MVPLLVEVQGEVVTVTLNRPEKLNALNEPLFDALYSFFRSLDRQYKVVILKGAGDRAFSAGADLDMLGKMDKWQASHLLKKAHSLFHKIATADQIVVAAVEGYLLGGGLELALVCDFIFASDGATLGMPEADHGLIPGFGGTKRLPKRIGRAKALEMMLLGKKWSAQESHLFGLVDQVTSKGKSYEAAQLVAKQIVKRPFEVIKSMKRAINAENDRGERALFLRCFTRRRDGAT